MKKQSLAALLAGLLLIGSLAGCTKGGSDESTADSGSSTTTEESTDSGSTTEESTVASNIAEGEIVEISMSVLDRGSVPADRGTYEENDAVDYINESMESKGVKLSVVPVPRSTSRDKMNSMLAAGTAPDILWEFSRPWMDQLRVQGAIVPIEDLINNYSTSYKEYYEENKALMDPYLRLEDGQIYAFSSLRAASALPTAGVWYRQDLLDEVNAEVPTTLDEVIEVSNQVKEAHPEIVPIAASYLHYLNIIKGTYGISSSEILTADGELIPPEFSENYKDALEMARRLYQEGIVDQEYLVDTTSSRKQQLWTSGQALFCFDSSGTPAGTKELIQTVEGADPYPLAPMESEYGQFMLTPQSATRFYVMINKETDAKQQEATVRLIDWMLEDGWYTISYGYEGEQFTLDEDGLRVGIAGAPSWPFGEFALVTQEVFVFGQSAVGEPDENYKFLPERSDRGMMEMLSYPVATVLPYDYSSDEYTELNASFSPKVSEIEAKMVSDPNYTVQDGIDELRSVFEQLGGDEIWAKKNAWYQENKDTLASFAEGYDTYKNGLLENSILDDAE